MSANLPSGLTHLHVHSHYTLLGGTASPADLITQAAADGLSCLALTDTNALYGAVVFSKACHEAGIQPIVGMAVTTAPPEPFSPAHTDEAGLLVLLATGPVGYRSLCRLSSHIQGHPDRLERAARGLSWEAIKAHREGLICISGGRRGWIERAVRVGDLTSAARLVAQLAGTFEDHACLALEIHQPADHQIAQEIADLGRRFGLPTVAVQPVYTLSEEDWPRLRLLAAIDHNCRLKDLPDSALPAPRQPDPAHPDNGQPAVDLHWLPAAELARRFAAFPQALAAIGEITARCDLALPALQTGSRPIWPAVNLPAGQTPDQALAELARSGLIQRFGSEPTPAVEQRLQTELAAIGRHGFAPLFLLVADIVRFARQQDIPVSTRGSVANSLVAYCTGITTVDPIRHDLLFERFLNPARSSLPDIDLDFCSRRRDEVLDYVRRKYGPERVALVATISTMRLKSAVREAGKAHGLTDAAISELIKQIPRGWHPDPRRRSRKSAQDIAQELHDPDLRNVVRRAGALVGQPHHLSIHPGAVVVTPGPLTDFVPLQWTAKGYLITQFDHQDVEALGLPKIDLLGIQALTVLADAAALVRQHDDPTFRLDTIPLDDPATGDLLARGDTVGVFQCESVGARRTLRQLQARSIQDLAVANAFFKPGPATGGMAQTFIRRYRGEAPVTYLHPALAPILAATKGVLIFQEQILRVATEIAGLSWAEADHLRRGMSKFEPQEMEAMQARFVTGCTRPPPDGPGLSPHQAETLWRQVQAFAGYGFNQGHATAYADVSYRSAYLKTHWPAAFLCARLAGWGGFHHPAIYMAEAVRLGIPVRPPHINVSGHKFTLQPARDSAAATLWMGLGQVRDLRRSAVAAIVQERQERPFAGLRDLLQRVPLQAREATHLIQCGGLDGLGPSRATLLAEAEQVQRAGSPRQLTFDFAAVPVPAESPAQRLTWEQHILGQPISVHPLELVAERLDDVVPLSELPATAGQIVLTAGVRLPGWTGGPGFFLGDGRTYIVAIAAESMPPPPIWHPLRVQGRWRTDQWGAAWLQATAIEVLSM